MAGGCHVPALFVSGVLFCWEVLSEATGAAECGQNDLVNLLQVPQQGLGFLFLDAYPSQYVARRLADGQSITIDGNLNESVWEEVPFTTTAFKRYCPTSLSGLPVAISVRYSRQSTMGCGVLASCRDM